MLNCFFFSTLTVGDAIVAEPVDFPSFHDFSCTTLKKAGLKQGRPFYHSIDQ